MTHRSDDRSPKMIAAVLLLAALGLCGCKGRSSSATGRSAIDLTEQVSLADSGSPDNLKRHLEVVRKGERKNSLVLVAPATVRIPLGGLRGKWVVKFSAAPVFDIGDGIQVSVFIRRAGTRVLKGSRYFDPGRVAEDRDWIPIEVPIEISPGDQLEIEAGAGPQGDLVADWLALSSLRLTP